jgi:hypothetical protein
VVDLTAAIRSALPHGWEQRGIWGRKPRQVGLSHQRRRCGNGRQARLTRGDGPAAALPGGHHQGDAPPAPNQPAGGAPVAGAVRGGRVRRGCGRHGVRERVGDRARPDELGARPAGVPAGAVPEGGRG